MHVFLRSRYSGYKYMQPLHRYLPPPKHWCHTRPNQAHHISIILLPHTIRSLFHKNSSSNCGENLAVSEHYNFSATYLYSNRGMAYICKHDIVDCFGGTVNQEICVALKSCGSASLRSSKSCEVQPWNTCTEYLYTVSESQMSH